jgi:hypothetical protein
MAKDKLTDYDATAGNNTDRTLPPGRRLLMQLQSMAI